MSVVGLNEQRALKANDNKLWTAKECAEAFVRDIDAGTVRPSRVLILYEEELPNGGTSVSTYAANVARDTEIALLHIRLHFATHKWTES